MDIITPKLLLAKLLKDKIKEKASSELTDAAFKPLTGLIESGQEKLLEVLGHIDPELADILNKAIAESYVAAVQEITVRYLNNQKNKILRAKGDIKRDEEIGNNMRALAAKPVYQIAPKMESTSISLASGIDDDQQITAELMSEVKEDLGELPEELRRRFEQQLLRSLRQQLWKRMAKSLKGGKGGALMNAFLLDLLKKVGAEVRLAESYAAWLARQMMLEFQLDRFQVDVDFLKIKTRYFVNREQVFRQIDRFLTTDSGYFVIRAEGGMGKTAVAAKYVLEKGDCLSHFLSYELGPGQAKRAGRTAGEPNTVESCLITLCQQLQDWLDVPVAASADLNILENRFNTLLRMKADERPQDKLVIVIDGLDEAKDLSRFFKYFPEHPLSNVYYIITTRPLTSIPRGFQTSPINLDPLNADDIRAMLAQVNEALARNESFISDTLRITGGEPLYLYHIMEDVSDLGEGAQQILDKIPARAERHLEEYYRWQLEKLIEFAVNDEQPGAGQGALDLLRTLSLLREAVTEQQLKEITGMGDIDYRRAYDKASRYLSGHTAYEETVYTLFHRRFKAVVYENYKNLSKKERKTYLRKILNYCREWTERVDEDGANSNDYTFRYYAEHLYEHGQEAGDFKLLFQLLSDKAFLSAKLRRFGRFSAVLPDVQLGIKAAAVGNSWLDALRFSLLEGYVRELATFRWNTGAILLDAVSGEVGQALSEARAIPVLDERGLQMLLIAEWLLRAGHDQFAREGREIVEEIVEKWSETRPFVTYAVEEEMMDFAVGVLFDHSREVAFSFLRIVNTPGTAEELSLLLTLATLDRDGVFADSPARPVTQVEYNEIVSAAASICSSYLSRTTRSHVDHSETDAPLTEGALKNNSLAEALFGLATGRASTETERNELHLMSQQVRADGLPAETCQLRALSRTVWQFWQTHRSSKVQTELPAAHRFIEEVRQLKGFMPIYSYLRGYLPLLTKDFAGQVSPALKGLDRSSPPFSDLLRFYLVKEAAGRDAQLAEKIAGKMTRPLLSALAYAYVVEALGPHEAVRRKSLAAKVFRDLQAEDYRTKELLRFDYQEEVIHAVSVIARASAELDWPTALALRFYSDELPLMHAKVVFSGGEKIVSPLYPGLVQSLRDWSTRIFEEEDLRDAPAYLAELARVEDEVGFESLERFLSSVKEFCEEEYGGIDASWAQGELRKLFTRDSFISFLETLSRRLVSPDLDKLLSFVTGNLPDLLTKIRVMSAIAVRYAQLGDSKAEALAAEIIKGYDEGLLEASPSIFGIRTQVLPSLVNVHLISPSLSSAAFEHLTSLLGVEVFSQQATQTPNSFKARLFFILASIADKIDRHDLRSKYLNVAESCIDADVKWSDEMTLDLTGQDLQSIKDPKILNCLLLLTRSAHQFEGASESYQTALAHAASHFARGLLNLTRDPVREINLIDSILDDVAIGP